MRFILILCLTAATTARSQEITVRPDAFAVAAEYAQAQFLTPIRDRALADVTVPSEYGPVKLSGIRLSVDDFEALSLRPGDESIIATLAIRRISIDVDHIQIPFGRGADCTGTTVRVGYSYPLTVAVELAPVAYGGDAHFELRSFRFDIPVSNYQTLGPSACGGLAVGNELVRRVVANTMAHAHTDLAQAIRDQALGFLAGVDGMVAAPLQAGININLPSMPLIAPGRVNLRPYLQDLRVDSRGVVVNASSSARRVPQTGGPAGDPTATPAVTPHRELGRIALSATQINEILAAIFSVRAAPALITPDQSELVTAVFFKDNFAPALPDLNDVRLDREEFAVAPELPPGSIPRVELTPTGALRVILPRLLVHMSCYQGGRLVPFFVLELAGALDFTTAAGAPSLFLDPHSVLHGSGNWEPAYTPRDRTIHQDRLEAFAHDFVAGLDGMDFFAQQTFPSFSLGRHRVGLMTLRFDPRRVTVAVGE